MTEGIPELPPPSEASPEEPKSWIEAISHAWVSLKDSDTNCDGLPDRLTPKTGCPQCGSAWMDVHQVAFANACHGGEFLGASWHVRQRGGVEPVMAARLRCCDGHLVEYDGIRLKILPRLSLWSPSLVLGIMGLTAAYVGAWAMRAGVK